MEAHMKRCISLILTAWPLTAILNWETASAEIPTDVLERTITVIGSDDAFSETGSQEEGSLATGPGSELSDLIVSGELGQLRSALLGGLLDDLNLGGSGLLDLNGGLLNGLDLGGLLNNGLLSDASVQLGEITRILNLNNTLGGVLRGL
jgi:hypothetical protein